MKLSAKQYARALYDSLLETNPKDQDTVLDNFVRVLAENNHLRLQDEIAQEFHKIELAEKGIKEVSVTTAKPLSKENEKQILDQMNKLVNSKVELKKQIDENILGGVVIRMDDQLIDASVKNSLEQLKKEITN